MGAESVAEAFNQPLFFTDKFIENARRKDD